MSDWNDIRYVLEVLRTGTSLAAARQLRVSQATVMRRIAALEKELDVELFDKRRTGYAATPLLATLLPRLEAVEAAHLDFEHSVEAIGREVSTTVTVTASELVCSIFLNKAIAQLRREHPAISIDLLASGRTLNLAVGEADVAIRAGFRPQDNMLFGRRLAHETWNFYCSQDYARENGIPQGIDDLHSHAVLVPQDKSFPVEITNWFRRHVPDSAVVVRHTGMAPIYYGVKAGVGVSLLSDFLTAGDTDLVCCFTPPEFSQSEVWLLTHDRHRQTARVRSVMAFLGRYFDTLRARALPADALMAPQSPAKAHHAASDQSDVL
ncbi:LysR family transcriptional regulator [Hoeflea marina]|uniref:LysR family transcriptional regulator n=1 Tax=Hoeflea marina TaxID=274592 RepID=A0A317PSE3_9HYPH|nr:LysR family transcriptional regulator [Hoeflea marina]PWW04388.1 LysR family transcriptional regulator [Hoeflea marina]